MDARDGGKRGVAPEPPLIEPCLVFALVRRTMVQFCTENTTYIFEPVELPRVRMDVTLSSGEGSEIILFPVIKTNHPSDNALCYRLFLFSASVRPPLNQSTLIYSNPRPFSRGTLVLNAETADLFFLNYMSPRVPSLPTKRRVRSYPAALFLALLDVFTTSPLARTTFMLTTLSFIVPYLFQCMCMCMCVYLLTCT